MAVTKATYTANATWTAANLAALFESAFIAAGYMTAWYDSFTSSGEHRVLEIVYNSGKTYGKAYYWFTFSTTGIGLAVCSAWNATTHVPTGTQYLDYLSTTAGSNPNLVTGLSTGTNFTLTRYTSGTASSHSWFVYAQGSTTRVFTISPPSHAPAAWIDLDKNLFHSFVTAAATTSAFTGNVNFTSWQTLRRSYAVGSSLNGSTSTGNNLTVAGFSGCGRGSASQANNMGFTSTAFSNIYLPVGLNAANSAYTSNYSPIFTGLPYSFYIASSPMPNDFGVYFHYANNTMARGDKIIVAAGSEEWEILSVANNATQTTGASACFLARVV